MNSDIISILLAGDFCPINRIETLAQKGDFDSIYNDFIDEFRGNDLNIVDLECPLTISDSARPKTGPHQKAHPENISILKHADIQLLAMANNHIMDYDAKGAEDTLDLCRANGISTVGIGVSPEEAAKPFSATLKGKRTAILNFADNEFLSSTDGNMTCNPIDPVRMFYDIGNASKSHDYVIVIIHGGNEYYQLPSPRIKILYRYIVDLGADAVISHHTHTFSGYEIYKSKPIFYGLGNFIYDWPKKINSSWNRGYAVKLLLSDQIGFELIPFNQCNEQPGLFHLDPQEKEVFQTEMDRLNQIIRDDQHLEQEFQDYCSSVFPMYDAFIEPYFGRYITALKTRGFFPRFLSRKKRLFLLNLTRCESHREVLMKLLKRNE